MANVTINSLGYVEVRGLAAAIETADCMLKCADVRLLRQLLRDPAQITLTVEGNLGACRAAVDAGQACARRLGALVSFHVMGRPARDTEDFVLSLSDEGRKAFGERSPAVEAKTEPAPASEPPARPEEAERVRFADDAALDAALIEALSGFPGGYSAQSLSKQLEIDWEIVRERLDALCRQGRLAKRRGRYHLLETSGGEG